MKLENLVRRSWLVAAVALASVGSCSSSEEPGKAELSESRIEFGQVDCGGEAPASKSVTITNAGPGALVYGVSVQTLDGFALEGANGGTLGDGESATITVSAPAVSTTDVAGRTFTGTLLVTTGVFNAPTFSAPISMQAAGAVFQVTPGLADFGVFPVGNQAPDIPITVTNTGNKAASVAFATPAGTDFTIDATSTAVEPGATKVVTTAHFTPVTTDLQQSVSAVTVQGGVCAGSAASLALKGQGSKGAFGVSPGTLDYGLTDCGTVQTPLAFTIANTGNAAVGFSLALGQGAGSPYTLSTSGGILLPNTQATITVSPKPVPAVSSTAANGRGDVLTITTDVPGDTAKTVDLRQTAHGAVLAFAAPALAFPTTVAGGTTPPALDLGIVNSGNASAQVTAVSTGTSQNATSFQVPAVPTTAVAGATTPLPITFDPLTIGLSLTNVQITTPDVLCGALPATPVEVRGESESIVALTQGAVAGGRQNNVMEPSQCARLVSGRVACWGANGNGQLGIGVAGGTRGVPHIVRKLTDVASVATSNGSSFALTTGGRVFAWGRNERFQLGTGNQDSSSVPIDIGLTGVTRIDADHHQACALTSSSVVLCWGPRARNRGGSDDPIPFLVMPPPAGTTYTAIAVAGPTVCALRADGQIDCQGANNRGQVGNGTTGQFVASAVRVSNITTATAIDGGAGSGRGGASFCAVLADGTVQCWGNLSRSKGGAAGSNTTPAPVTVPGLSGITQISVGSQHACALQGTTGPVFCWGNNNQGQVGTAPSGAQTPIAVPGLTAPTRVIVGGRRSCALATGGFFCWGEGAGPTPSPQPGF